MKIELRTQSTTYIYNYSRGHIKRKLLTRIWLCVSTFFKKKTPSTQTNPETTLKTLPSHLEILDPTHLDVAIFLEKHPS